MHENSKKNLSEEELAVLAANGDDEAMSLLIAAISPIANAKAAQYSHARISGEDLSQEGMIGFIKAVYSFDPSKGVKFRTYANTLIRNEIYTAYEKMFNRKNEALTGAVSLDNSENDGSSVAESAENIVIDIFEYQRLLDVLKKHLSEFEQQVIDLKIQGKNRAQIADELECTIKAVDNAFQRIRKKIKEKF
ncbi:MAG: sigma-70 family RNA polymerase sigma factor [Clostridia bacterium]|nr:sigma-70 family RNA polymerase sigma factor [Clostridia bacterium]